MTRISAHFHGRCPRADIAAELGVTRTRSLGCNLSFVRGFLSDGLDYSKAQ